MKRFHVHLHVVADPTCGSKVSIDHLGIQADNAAMLKALAASADMAVLDEGAACC